MMENNPWWPRRGPAHTVPPHPSENTSWRGRFDEKFTLPVPSSKETIVAHWDELDGVTEFWKSTPIKAFFAAELQSLISQLEELAQNVPPYPVENEDTNLANYNLRLGARTGYRDAIAAAQDLIKTYL